MSARPKLCTVSQRISAAPFRNSPTLLGSLSYARKKAAPRHTRPGAGVLPDFLPLPQLQRPTRCGRLAHRLARIQSGLAPDPVTTPEAVVQVYSARAVGWRGWFGVHTWIAVKPANATEFTVHEVNGWRLRRTGTVVMSTQSAGGRPLVRQPAGIVRRHPRTGRRGHHRAHRRRGEGLPVPRPLPRLAGPELQYLHRLCSAPCARAARRYAAHGHRQGLSRLAIGRQDSERHRRPGEPVRRGRRGRRTRGRSSR